MKIKSSRVFGDFPDWGDDRESEDMYLYPVLHAWIVQNLYDGSDRNTILREITGRYFNASFVSVFFSAANPREDGYRGSLLRVLHENWSVQVYDRKVQADFRTEVKSDGMIILFVGDHDEKNVFHRLKEFRDTFSWNSRGRTIIIADDSPVLYMSTIWRISRAVEVGFWAFARNELYAWQPYRKDECDILKTIHRVTTNGLFKPVSLMNLNGCPLIASASFIPPFVLRVNNKTHMYDNGVECKIMDIIAEKMNGKLIYVEIPKSELPWVWQTKDGKLVGAIGMLDRHEADVAYSGMAINYERFRFAEPLTSHAQDEITWLVPTPNKGNPLQGLFKIFSIQIWVMAYAMLVFIAILMYYEEGKISFVKCFTDALVAVMNLPMTRKSRFLPTLLYFAAVHIGTAYQAMLLFSLVREITNKPIETLEEAVNANLTVNMPPSFRILINATDHHLWNRILQPGRHNFSIAMIDHMENMIFNKTSIALYPKYTAIFVINLMFPDGNYGPKVMMLNQRMAISSLAFFTPRGHPLKPSLDRRMNEVLAGGFGEMWLRRYLKNDWSRAKELKADPTTEPLKTSNLQSILIIYVVLNLVSIIVFIAEILYESCRSRRKIRQR